MQRKTSDSVIQRTEFWLQFLEISGKSAASDAVKIDCNVCFIASLHYDVLTVIITDDAGKIQTRN
ncbi:hypothetical protein DXA98_06020 [Lachnospiraceae bacterium OF09-6]|nr:hypothetical protein DXA98_06020 [Lachnospiraceae bacterium OF09-6]